MRKIKLEYRFPIPSDLGLSQRPFNTQSDIVTKAPPANYKFTAASFNRKCIADYRIPAERVSQFTAKPGYWYRRALATVRNHNSANKTVSRIFGFQVSLCGQFEVDHLTDIIEQLCGRN